AKILPENVEFVLRPRKADKSGVSHGHYAIAEVVAQNRHEFQMGAEVGTGKPKITLIFGEAIPKGAPIPEKTGPKAVSLDTWKNQYAK
ncbi:MAG: hypothetical protein KGI27_13750, partial [Thaumarchaeota archaeon]|nr:hypothetical protein [Nitrososphaerota archaeon]